MDTTDTTQRKTEVQYCVAWLNEAAPGWADKVDTRTLDLRGGNCLLIQVFGYYYGAMKKWMASRHFRELQDAHGGFYDCSGFSSNTRHLAEWIATIEDLRTKS